MGAKVGRVAAELGGADGERETRGVRRWRGAGSSDATPRFRGRTSEAQPGADGEAAAGEGRDGCEEGGSEAGVGIAEVVAAGEQLESGLPRAPVGESVKRVDADEGVAVGRGFLGGEAGLLKRVAGFGAERPATVLVGEAEAEARGRDAGEGLIVGRLFGVHGVTEEREVEPLVGAVDEVKLDLGFGAVEQSVAGDELVDGQILGAGAHRICAQGAGGVVEVAAFVALFEDEVVDPVHEYAGGTGDEARALAEGEVEAEGVFVVEAGGADLVGAGAAMGTVGE